jgi:membrane protease YdiL (CAAX protease family)
MQTQRFPERRPVLFSFLLVLLLVAIQAMGVVAAERMDLLPTSLQIFTGCALALALSAILFVPALALVVGNLTFGISQAPFMTIVVAAVAAASSGFVEEVVFRGLMLRAFLPRGHGQR